MIDFAMKDPAGRIATIPSSTPFCAYNDGTAALVSDFGVASIEAATQGIKSIVTILQQREIDLECGDDEGLLKLAPVTVSGLLLALATCAEAVEQHATGKSSHGHELNQDQYNAAFWAATKSKAGG